ncbi:hypothetical protein ACFL1B_01930 [Nanoarchaeota archaeon]
MKRITMLVLASYIISIMIIPFAFAEANAEPTLLAVDTTATENGDDGKTRPKPMLVQKRQVTVQKVKVARERYQNALTRYKGLKDAHKAHKEEFQDTKKDLKECQTLGEDCSELEDQAFEDAQKYLLNVIDRMIEQLEQLKARFEGADSITDEQENEALSHINRVLAALEEIKTDVENAEDKDDLQEASKQLRRIWQNAQKAMKKNTYRMIGRKVGLIVNQAEGLGNKLDCALSTVNNTSEIQELLDKYDRLVAAAHDEFDLAREAWESEDDVDSAKEHIKNGHEYLKEAHELVKEIVKKLREADATLRCGRDRPTLAAASDSDDSDEADEEDEEESDEDDSDEEDEEDESEDDEEDESEEEEEELET